MSLPEKPLLSRRQLSLATEKHQIRRTGFQKGELVTDIFTDKIQQLLN